MSTSAATGCKAPRPRASSSPTRPPVEDDPPAPCVGVGAAADGAGEARLLYDARVSVAAAVVSAGAAAAVRGERAPVRGRGWTQARRRKILGKNALEWLKLEESGFWR